MKYDCREAILTDELLNLPDNHTIEFDVIPISDNENKMAGYQVRLLQAINAKAFDHGSAPGKGGFFSPLNILADLPILHILIVRDVRKEPSEDIKKKMLLKKKKTSSDGADASNLDLSKRRDASVKNELTKTFGIDASRLESDGMGESQPVAANDSPANKALNRRVEFIKL